MQPLESPSAELASVLTLKQALAMAGDTELDAEEQIQLELLRGSLGDVLYADALAALAGRRTPAAEARREWEGLLAHRADLEARLKRPVGVQTAALDRFYAARPRQPEAVVVPHGHFEAIMRDSRIDPVTGLSTPGSFTWSLDHELRRARRYKKNVVLVLVDLDDTTDLNARKGEAFVDFCLREVAGLIRENTRATDTAARLDEDVFGVVLPECKVSDACALAERLRQKIETQSFAMYEGDDGAHITASIGVAGYPRNASDAASLQERAREILFRAKERGKNRVEWE